MNTDNETGMYIYFLLHLLQLKPTIWWAILYTCSFLCGVHVIAQCICDAVVDKTSRVVASTLLIGNYYRFITSSEKQCFTVFHLTYLFGTKSRKVSFKWLATLLHIFGVPDLNLVLGTGSSDSCLSWFQPLMVLQINSLSLLFVLFQIYTALALLLIDTVYCTSPTADRHCILH